MAKPRPSPGEWNILQALWKLGPVTVRAVHEEIAAERPGRYTTTLKLMQIMARKGMVQRDETARAHLYKPAVARQELQADAAEELLERVFGGSVMDLLQRVLARKKMKRGELKELRRMIEALEAKRK